MIPISRVEKELTDVPIKNIKYHTPEYKAGEMYVLRTADFYTGLYKLSKVSDILKDTFGDALDFCIDNKTDAWCENQAIISALESMAVPNSLKGIHRQGNPRILYNGHHEFHYISKDSVLVGWKKTTAGWVFWINIPKAAEAYCGRSILLITSATAAGFKDH